MIYTWFTTFMASFAIFPGAPHLYSNSILAPDSGVDATEVGEYLRSTTLHNTSHISHEFIWYLVRLYNKCISIIGVYPISSLLYIYIQNIYIYRIYIYTYIYIHIVHLFMSVFNASHWGHLLCHGNLLLGVLPASSSHLGFHAAQPDGQSQHLFAHGSCLAGAFEFQTEPWVNAQDLTSQSLGHGWYVYIYICNVM